MALFFLFIYSDESFIFISGLFHSWLEICMEGILFHPHLPLIDGDLYRIIIQIFLPLLKYVQTICSEPVNHLDDVILFFIWLVDSSEGVKFIFHLTFLCCFTGLAEREVERQTSGDCFEIGLNWIESCWFEHCIELNWIRTLWMFWCVELQYFADLVFLCYHDMSWLDKGRYIRLSI